MTHLDIITTILSEVTGQTKQHWRRVMIAALTATGTDIATQTRLLDPLPQVDANALLTRLRAPTAKQGVLSWLVSGAVAAQRSQSPDLQRFKMLMSNRQN